MIESCQVWETLAYSIQTKAVEVTLAYSIQTKAVEVTLAYSIQTKAVEVTLERGSSGNDGEYVDSRNVWLKM
ncbi:hypothetical protein Bpfe_009371, partial [Biomphalaria pfeifferi]